VNVRVVAAGSLSAEELACWSRIQQSVPSLCSPFFAPTFTSIVATTRADVWVAVLEQDGRPLGFFPFERGRLGSGRPVGSIISDYHGVVVPEDISWDGRALIRACGLKTWEFHQLVTSQDSFEPFHHARRESMQIDLTGGFETYMNGIRQMHATTLRRLARNTRKLEREHGTLRFEQHTDDPAALAMLLRWKSAQYARTGAVEILKREWIREALRLAHATQTMGFAGVLSFLFAGDTPVAALFSIRSGEVCHCWFPAYDPEFAQYSPGLTLLLKLAEGAQQADIKVLDLGAGDYGYKRIFMNRSVALAQGAIERPSVAAGAARTERAAKWLVRRTAMAPRLRRLARASRRGQ
jgi:CelD/BcsL family acetyltransferase involved in cellulose biosynthesis